MYDCPCNLRHSHHQHIQIAAFPDYLVDDCIDYDFELSLDFALQPKSLLLDVLFVCVRNFAFHSVCLLCFYFHFSHTPFSLWYPNIPSF